MFTDDIMIMTSVMLFKWKKIHVQGNVHVERDQFNGFISVKRYISGHLGAITIICLGIPDISHLCKQLEQERN